MNTPEELKSSIPEAWDAAMAAFPPEKYAAEVLSPAAIEKNAKLAQFSFDALPELLKTASAVRDNPSLLSLAAYIHWTYFASPEFHPAIDYPELNGIVEKAPLFYLLVTTGFCSEYIRRQSEFGVCREVLENTCQQVGRYADNFFMGRKKTGIFTNQLSWLRNYMPPNRYFRIGRLEFCQSEFNRPYTVYRHKRSGELAAICDEGQWFNTIGNPCFTEGDLPLASWQTTLVKDAKSITGYRITDRATAELSTTTLKLADWKPVLSKGDHVLEMHIPGGGGMSQYLVRKSISEAVAFFDKYFPDNGIKGITSTSWIFSTQLAECLPADSNILAFQKMLHLVPVSSGRNNGLWFVFRTPAPYIPANLPRETSLQRAIADWLAGGKTFRCGSMFLLRGEAEKLSYL